MKSFVKTNFPTFFIWARKLKDQALIELRTVKSVGVGTLIFSFTTNRLKKDNELPVQTIKSISIQGIDFDSEGQLESLLKEGEAGGHSYYLDPTKWGKSVFAPLQKKYPIGCGIKIRKTLGDKSSKGLSKESTGRVQSYLVESHAGQLMVANFLNAKGISPRIYDIVEINGKGSSCVAHIVEHVSHTNKSEEKCREIVNVLKEQTLNDRLNLVNWNGFDDGDFECPSCNRNLLLTSDERPQYVDTQNFSIGKNFFRHLIDVAEESRDISHFGDQSKILGGKYLYQKIPGLDYPAKRDPASRAVVFDEMLESAGLSLQNALVVDVGCNIGLMGAQYLKRSSHWVHGIDMPVIVEKAHAISLAIGLTRFSYRGCKIDTTIDLLNGAPDFYYESDMPLWISYLAIRGHIGWVDHLSSLDWDYMLYEGHENDDIDDTQRQIADLNEMVSISVVAEHQVTDGTSGNRCLAILARIK